MIGTNQFVTTQYGMTIEFNSTAETMCCKERSGEKTKQKVNKLNDTLASALFFATFVEPLNSIRRSAPIRDVLESAYYA